MCVFSPTEATIPFGISPAKSTDLGTPFHGSKSDALLRLRRVPTMPSSMRLGVIPSFLTWAADMFMADVHVGPKVSSGVASVTEAKAEVSAVPTMIRG